jgi:glutamate--cysteine ligase
MLDRDAFARDLRENAFGFRRHTLRPPSIGAEVELIPVHADTRRIVPILPNGSDSSDRSDDSDDSIATLPFLRRFGARHGWREEESPYGAPRFVMADGGVVSYEPGGQIEISSAPFHSASALLASLRSAVVPLVREARDEGIDLLSIGIDPVNDLSTIPLQLPGKRYVRLTRFLESIGTGGVRMMRQTASFQCNLDWGADALARWRFLNAAAPYATAVFASSPVYRGADTGHRSFRARVWRELDGGRTGLFPCGADPIAEYLEFALAAPAILLPFADGDWRPFAAWNGEGRVTMDDWHDHLTTLFPEVRPKGFVEVRAIDAVQPEWYAAPLVFLAGLTYHAPTFAAARELVGAPDAALLERASRLGLRDDGIATTARELFELALSGAAALGPAFLCPADLAEARAFFDAYTSRARSPADDALADAPSPAAATV